jgi:partitioning defective protein 3
MGLIIHRIEPSGRIFKDGRIKPGDRIVEINEKILIGIDFKQSQEILRDALNTSINQNGLIEFKLIRNIDIFNKYLANIHIEKHQEQKNEKTIEILNDDDSETINSHYENETSCDTTNQQITNSFSNNSLSITNINGLNTRKIGCKVTIQLIKGDDGLGFKLAARDNCTPGEFSPIYVKNILPKGAAIQDGRLQRGDRLLEVNKIDMTQKTVTEAVNILRNTKMGSCVELVVSRQIVSNNNTSISINSNNSLAESLKQNEASVRNDNEQVKKIINKKETLILDIPLNDTGSAGLGVSVKGKTKKNDNEKIIDLGIFVKIVINGGAASKDGRLKPNDQLIKINGISLLNKSNEEAMQILRESMQVESSKPGHIELVVTRKKYSTKENNLIQTKATDNNINNNTTNNNREVLKIIKNDNENSNNNNNNNEENNVNNTTRFNRDAPSRRSMSEKRTKIGSSGSSTSAINKFQRKTSIQKTQITSSSNNSDNISLNNRSISQKPPLNYGNKEDDCDKQNHSCNQLENKFYLYYTFVIFIILL